MKDKKVKLNHRRVYSEEFKKARVHEYESGEFTVQEISKMFNIRHKLVYEWIYKFSSYNKKKVILVEMKDSAKNKLKEYEKRIADLERALGQKQLNIDYLEKMIELAKEEYQIDIKKNSNTPLSHGSEKIDKKRGLK